VQVQVQVQSPTAQLNTAGSSAAYFSPMQAGTTPTKSAPAPATQPTAAPAPTAAENKAPQGRARALSKREEILANRRPSISAGAATPKAGNMPEISAPAPAPAPVAAAQSFSAANAYPPPPGTPGPAVDMGSYERVLSKNLTLTNELNDRDTEIIALKKREAVYEQTLKAKEKMYEQDANVRMQLGRRLEQILLDKEEAKDEIDDLRMHIGKLEGMLLDFSRERAEREASAALQVQQVLKAGAERSPSKC
jgi:pyruvate/2-oxoglutarate dehydrogenase complex dihydrolipoamide acyltransferase (E2) component